MVISDPTKKNRLMEILAVVQSDVKVHAGFCTWWFTLTCEDAHLYGAKTNTFIVTNCTRKSCYIGLIIIFYDIHSLWMPEMYIHSPWCALVDTCTYYAKCKCLYHNRLKLPVTQISTCIQPCIHVYTQVEKRKRKKESCILPNMYIRIYLICTYSICWRLFQLFNCISLI